MRIQIRRDSALDWSIENPILAEGEFGLDMTNDILKIGDGVTYWNNLTGMSVYGGITDAALAAALAGPLTDAVLTAEIQASSDAAVATAAAATSVEIITKTDSSGARPGLAAWHAALGNRDTTPAKVLIMGDSIMEGWGCGVWENSNQYKYKKLLRLAYPTTGVATPGEGYIPAITAANGPPPPVTVVTGGGTATPVASNIHAGLGMKGMSLTGGAYVQWGPYDCDRVRIWCTQNDFVASDGVFVLDGVDSGVLDGVNIPYRGGQVFDSGPLTPGLHTVRARGDGGFAFLVEAAEFFNDDWDKGVHVYDGAHFGFSLADFIGSGPDRTHWSGYTTLLPQLTVINLGTNDIVTRTGAAMLADVDTILAKIASLQPTDNYSVLLVMPYRPSRTSASDPDWIAYREGLLARRSYLVEVLDLDASWPVLVSDGSRNQGLMYEATDPLHPNTAGHDYIARILARATTVTT